MGVSHLLDLLRADPKLSQWLDELENTSTPDVEIGLPTPTALPEILLDLAVPHEDINELLALQAKIVADPALSRLLNQCAGQLIRGIGAIGDPFQLPDLPPGSGVLGRMFYVLVFVAVRPHTLKYHRERDIPHDISRYTLADLGRHIAVHRRRHNTGGILVPWWLRLHFRGEIYQLGRLQFQRARLGDRTGTSIRNAGMPLGPGDPTLEVHIPSMYGSLTPEACDRSVAQARAFFRRHFPDETYKVATIHSWTLDPQLRDYLPADSNLLRFQDRFRPGDQPTEPRDDDPVSFVFQSDQPLDTLPRRTTLERAIIDHLLNGTHWYGGTGWFEL